MPDGRLIPGFVVPSGAALPPAFQPQHERDDMKKLPKLLLALSALAVAASASAQVKPDDAIKYRKAGYA